MDNTSLNEFLETCSNRVIQNITDAAMVLSNIKWKKVSFTVDTEPVPSHRPRLCGYRVYVPGAAKNQAFFNKKVLPKLNGLYISTPCKFDVEIYSSIPKSFTKTQTALAEMKLLRPYGNIGDVDNYSKAILDMLQPNEKRGHVGILADDCLVFEMTSTKYYSFHPRYEVTITYMDEKCLSDELKKILRLRDMSNML